MDNSTLSPTQMWDQVFARVQRAVNVPMLWLAMQAARPVTIDGSFFVLGLAKDQWYLAVNLETFENVSAIEDALRDVSGRILALRLIEGTTLADWQAARNNDIPTLEFESAPLDFAPPDFAASFAAPSVGGGGGPVSLPPEAPREVYPTWEKLGERFSPMYKVAPGVRYPHGQARFVLDVVKYISDTMDVLMPGGQGDDHNEKMLSKTMERLSSTVNLDPIFLSLELFRYRASRGK